MLSEILFSLNKANALLLDRVILTHQTMVLSLLTHVLPCTHLRTIISGSYASHTFFTSHPPHNSTHYTLTHFLFPSSQAVHITQQPDCHQMTKRHIIQRKKKKEMQKQCWYKPLPRAPLPQIVSKSMVYP